MKNNLITQEMREKVAEEYERLWTIRWVQRELWEALWLTFHNVRDIVNALEWTIDKQKSELEDIKMDIKPAYEVGDDHYIFYLTEEDNYWNKTTKAHPIEIKTVDEIFKAYSKHWENKTGEQILQEFKIKPEVWNIIKRRLRLYKDSHILSPVSLERFEWREEEMEEFIEWAVKENIQDKYIDKFKDIHEKEFKKEAKKAMKRLSELDVFLDWLRDYISEYEPKQINFERPETFGKDSIDIVISDIHIGKQGTDEIENRMINIANDIIKTKENNINLFCLWDLGEILVEWGRHPWQIESMDWPYGFDLFMKIVNLFEQFLLEIYKTWKNVRFIGIAWNHWTLSDKKWWDVEFTGELLIYELIKRWLQNTKIEIDYIRERRASVDTENFHYVINHGTWPDTKKKAEQILREHGNNQKYNILMQWDKHHSRMEEVNEKATRLLIPALAWQNVFDKNICVSSSPWFVKITKNDDDLPDIQFKKIR